MTAPLFPLGWVVATLRALSALEEAGVDALEAEQAKIGAKKLEQIDVGEGSSA